MFTSWTVAGVGVGITALGASMMLGGVVQMLYRHSPEDWPVKNPLTIKRPTPLGA
jgi:predicted phage tail protein